MFEKKIAYHDFYGNPKEKTFMFNLSKAELSEMQFSTIGGLDATIRRVIDTDDTPALIKIFKEIILKSYGVISPDGERFIKSEEDAIAFSQTNAYVQLYMELSHDAKAASEFINGIIPEADRLALAGKENNTPVIAAVK